MPKGVVAKGLAKSTAVAGGLAVAGFKEAPQEYLQTLGEAFNKKYGTEEYEDKGVIDVATDSEVLKEATVGAIIGGPSGTTTAAGAQAIKGSGKGLKALNDTKFVQAAKKDLAGVSDATVDKAKGFIDKSKGISEADRATLDKLAVNNPELDPKEAETAIKAMNSDTAEAVDKEVFAKVAVQEPSITETITGTTATPEAKEAATNFDKAFDTIMSESIDRGQSLAANEKSGKLTPENAAKVAPFVVGSTQAALDAYTALVDSGASKEALELADKKIGQLTIAADLSTPTEIHAALTSDSIDTKSKVRTVLGSSAATESDLRTVLGSIADNPYEGSDKDTKLVEAKIELLKTYSEVTTEKLIGGGTKPGVFQWMSMLQDNAVGASALGEIQRFASSQATKLDKLVKAKEEYKNNGGKPVTIKELTKGKDFIYHGPNQSDGFIDTVTKENASITKLLDIATDVVTPKASTKPVVEETPTPQANVQEETIELSETANTQETMIDEEAKRPGKYSVQQVADTVIPADAGIAGSVRTSLNKLITKAKGAVANKESLTLDELEKFSRGMASVKSKETASKTPKKDVVKEAKKIVQPTEPEITNTLDNAPEEDLFDGPPIEDTIVDDALLEEDVDTRAEEGTVKKEPKVKQATMRSKKEALTKEIQEKLTEAIAVAQPGITKKLEEILKDCRS